MKKLKEKLTKHLFEAILVIVTIVVVLALLGCIGTSIYC